MNKKYLIIGGLSALVLALVATSAASAYGGEFKNKGDKSSPEDRQAFVEVIESGNYEAWTSLVGDKPITKHINEDNFDRFVEMHNLIKAGDVDGAKEIRKELNLPVKKAVHKMGRKIKQNIPVEVREAIKEALDNNDYNAWAELVGDRPVAEKINADNFDRLVEMHELMQTGDREGANEIRKELDLHPMKRFLKNRMK